MSNVLNLALKKDVFEALKTGETSEIVIEKTNWWKKRLIDENTGRFKEFSVVNASCGSADKVEYVIEKIELIENNFVITVIGGTPNTETAETAETDHTPEDPVETPEDVNEEFLNEDVQEEVEDVTEEEDPEEVVVEPEIIEPEIVEPVQINPVVVDTVDRKPILSQEEKDAIVNRFVNKVNEEQKEIEESDVRDNILKVINSFCTQKDVYVVNMPFVTIRNNGQIFGSTKRLIADRDSDVRFDFIKREFVQGFGESDVQFISQIKFYLTEILRNNYVFINRKACGFKTDSNGNLVFTIYAIGKKKYLFSK